MGVNVKSVAPPTSHTLVDAHQLLAGDSLTLYYLPARVEFLVPRP